MVEGFEIRAFEAGDLERLHEIRDAAFQPVFASFRALVGAAVAGAALTGLEEEQGDHLDRLADPETPQTLYVVTGEAGIVGFMGLSLDAETQVGEIDLNAVDPAHQGRGIGTMLYDFALARMREAGMKAATVGTGGDESHLPARQAYAKVGFAAGIPSVYLYRVL